MSDISAGVPALTPDMTFDQAARGVLGFLKQRLPWALWSITRVENGVQTHLRLDDDAYGIEVGDEIAWDESVCIKMVAGEGPRFAADASRVPVYAQQPGVRDLDFGAYAGVPIVENGGRMFGVLCGMNTVPVEDLPSDHLPMLELICSLLGMVLAADRVREVAAREALEARLEADTDALTGLYSRRAWDALIERAEESQRIYADPMVVVMIDLDGLKAINDGEGHAAGDAFIQRAGRALRSVVRASDPVARLGGDEFAVLLRDVSDQGAPVRVERIRTALDDAGVTASVGWASYRLATGFPAALAVADAAMYEEKAARKSGRRSAMN